MDSIDFRNLSLQLQKIQTCADSAFIEISHLDADLVKLLRELFNRTLTSGEIVIQHDTVAVTRRCALDVRISFFEILNANAVGENVIQHLHKIPLIGNIALDATNITGTSCEFGIEEQPSPEMIQKLGNGTKLISSTDGEMNNDLTTLVGTCLSFENNCQFKDLPGNLVRIIPSTGSTKIDSAKEIPTAVDRLAASAYCEISRDMYLPIAGGTPEKIGGNLSDNERQDLRKFLFYLEQLMYQLHLKILARIHELNRSKGEIFSLAHEACIRVIDSVHDCLFIKFLQCRFRNLMTKMDPREPTELGDKIELFKEIIEEVTKICGNLYTRSQGSFPTNSVVGDFVEEASRRTKALTCSLEYLAKLYIDTENFELPEKTSQSENETFLQESEWHKTNMPPLHGTSLSHETNPQSGAERISRVEFFTDLDTLTNRTELEFAEYVKTDTDPESDEYPLIASIHISMRSIDGKACVSRTALIPLEKILQPEHPSVLMAEYAAKRVRTLSSGAHYCSECLDIKEQLEKFADQIERVRYILIGEEGTVICEIFLFTKSEAETLELDLKEDVEPISDELYENLETSGYSLPQVPKGEMYVIMYAGGDDDGGDDETQDDPTPSNELLGVT